MNKGINIITCNLKEANHGTTGSKRKTISQESSPETKRRETPWHRFAISPRSERNRGGMKGGKWEKWRIASSGYLGCRGLLFCNGEKKGMEETEREWKIEKWGIEKSPRRNVNFLRTMIGSKGKREKN